MAQNNGGKWDKNFVAAVVAIIVGAVVTIGTPELRKIFCLEKQNPTPQQQTFPQPLPTPVVPQIEPKATVPRTEAPPAKPAAVPKTQPPVIQKAEQEPAGPQQYTIGNNKIEWVQEAKTRLSVKFYNIGGVETASVTISPAGKDSIVLPTVGSGSQEFASSTGVFLVHVLNVDWNSRTVTVQVSRKL